MFMRKYLLKSRYLCQPSLLSNFFLDLFLRLLHSTQKHKRELSHSYNRTGVIVEYSTFDYCVSQHVFTGSPHIISIAYSCNITAIRMSTTTTKFILDLTVKYFPTFLRYDHNHPIWSGVLSFGQLMLTSDWYILNINRITPSMILRFLVASFRCRIPC